jgi:hypothetical protein
MADNNDNSFRQLMILMAACFTGCIVLVVCFCLAMWLFPPVVTVQGQQHFVMPFIQVVVSVLLGIAGGILALRLFNNKYGNKQ